MKTILSCLMCVFAFAASAEDVDPFDEMFAAGDYAAIAAHVAQLHADHVAGDAPASALREPFGKFSTTSPQIPALVEAWLEAEPESPYAHAAAAWLHYGQGWRLRGQDTLRYSWPAAIEAFNREISLSQAHAWAAYELAPDLLPATDALLSNELVTRQLGPNGIYALVEEVMTTTPNRGTLYKASSAFQPNWGGDLDRIDAMCARNAPRVTSIADYTADACIADMILANSVRGERAWDAVATLTDHGWAGFEHHLRSMYQMSIATSPDLISDEEVAAYLMQDGIWDFALAQQLYSKQFDYYPRPDVDLRVEATQIILRHKAIARDMLANDPGNTAIVEMVLFDTRTAVDRAAHPARADVIAIYGDVLRSQPYAYRWWMRVGDAQREMTEGGYRAGGLGAYGNAITYSNHHPWVLGTILRGLAYSHNLPFDPPEEGFVQAEYDEAVLCPAIRVARLLDAVCEATRDHWVCNNRADLDERTDPMKADAVARGVCETERMASPRQIAFYSTALQVGDYAHPSDW